MFKLSEPEVSQTNNDNSPQYRQGTHPPQVVARSSSQLGVVAEESQLHHYWEIDDADRGPPVERTDADSSDVEPKTLYDHPGHVPQRNTLSTPVYLQLITDDDVVEQQSVPTASQTGTESFVMVPVSQALSAAGEPVQDIVQ